MEFRVLGPIELLGDAGARVRLVSERQRRLVAILAVHAGRTVGAEVLGDALDLNPGALRTSVSRLRRVVGFDVLVTSPPGYELRTDRVDAVAFERLLHDVADARGPARRALLREALGLWRGSAYAEFGHEQWAMAEVTRLEELRCGAVELLAESEIHVGETTAAIARLDELIAVHPFADRPRGLLMEALAASGRRPEALRVFAQYRRLLAEEVGTDPGPELVALDRRVASGADAAKRNPPRPVPMRLTSLVGRDDDVDAVIDLVGRNRLTTLTGAGGCGKTSLALEALRRIADRHDAPVVWVELASARTGDDVLDLLMAACGVGPVAGSDRLAALAQRLDDDGPVLLVVDNAEHVRDAVVTDVVPLLRTCRRLRVLVTSRLPLDVIGETVRRVPPLSLPPVDVGSESDLLDSGAGALLVERMRSIRSDVVLDAGSVAVLGEICRRLEGLPLALELAAGRMRSLSPGRVAEALRGELVDLGAGDADGSDRHRTMRASIEWSVDLLGAAERVALSRLAAFVGPFSEEDVVGVMGSDGKAAADAVSGPTAPDLLARLVDANLAWLDDTSGLYRISEATRAILREPMPDRPDAAESDARHARWIAEWCLEVGAGRRGIDRRAFQERMPDVVAATAWGRGHDPLVVFDICRGLASMRLLLGHLDDLERTWVWLMAYDRSGPSAGRWASATAALLAAATNVGWDTGGIDAEVTDLLAADDGDGRRWVDRCRAMAPAGQGDVGPALEHARAVVAAGNDLEMSMYVGFAAYMAASCGRLADADELIDALRLMVQRHGLAFDVDAVGNAHGAAVVASIARGDRPVLVELATGSAPTDPTFSATSSSMLAHAAVLFGSDALLARALSWGSTETIPALRFLRPLDRFHQAMSAGQTLQAARLAEEFDDGAHVLPVSRFHPRALLNVPLIETGAIASVRRSIAVGEHLLGDVPDTPYLDVQLLLSRAQVALAVGDVVGASRAADAAGAVAARQGYALAAIDAAELSAVAAHLGGASGEETARRLAGPLGSRAALGYRAVMVAPRERYDTALAAAGCGVQRRRSAA